jgi:hypothetical protein
MRQLAAKNKKRIFVDSWRRSLQLVCDAKKLLFPLAVLIASATVVFPEIVVAPDVRQKRELIFVDQPNDRNMEWSEDGQLSTLLQPSGHANGMMFDVK